MTLAEAELEPDWKPFKLMLILSNMVNYHSRLYYENDSPVLTDAEFDKLYFKLVALEEQYPHLVQDDSPTRKVGGRASDGFKKVKHIVPCLSLEKVHTVEELREWDAKMRRLLSE